MEKNTKRKYKSNEKQLSARLKGFDFSDFEIFGVKGIDVFRYGLIKIKEEHKNPHVVKLKSKIHFIENRMLERELDQVADELLLKQLYSELIELEGFTSKKKEELISLISMELSEFMIDERYDEDVRNDLSMFYTVRRDGISLIAMKYHKSYEQAIEIFDNYLEEVAVDSVVEQDVNANQNG